MLNNDSYMTPALPMGPATTPSMLEDYSHMSYPYLRFRVAQHPNTPVHVLRNLVDDRDPAVARAAHSRVSQTLFGPVGFNLTLAPVR